MKKRIVSPKEKKKREKRLAHSDEEGGEEGEGDGE